MKKIIVLLFLVVSMSKILNSQNNMIISSVNKFHYKNSSVSDALYKIKAAKVQTKSLNKEGQDIRVICVEPIKPTTSPIYVLDGLELDAASYSEIKIDKKSIRKIKPNIQKNKVFLYSKMLIIVDNVFLLSKKDKYNKLSMINKKDIVSIEYLTSIEEIEKYGMQGRFGVLIIKTKK